MEINITKATLGDLNRLVGEADDIDIFFKENVLDYNLLDFKIYKNELQKIADKVILAFKMDKRHISVNVLTDMFSIKSKERDKCLLFCKHCPCFHCEPDQELFKKATGDSYIPPWQFCEKAFSELETTRFIVNQLNLNIEVSDVDRVLFEEYIDLLYGTDLGR